jgi:hypothetical protein
VNRLQFSANTKLRVSAKTHRDNKSERKIGKYPPNRNQATVTVTLCAKPVTVQSINCSVQSGSQPVVGFK